LTTDLYAQQSKIDRRYAFEWITALNQHIIQPDPEDLVSQDTKLSPRVGDALAALMQAGNAVEIFVHDQFSIESLHQSPMCDLFALAHCRGAPMTLVLDRQQFNKMDMLERVTIRDCAQRHRFSLATSEKYAASGDSKLLAILTQNGRRMAYYSRDHEAGIPGESWGMGLKHPVVSDQISGALVLTSIEPQELEMQTGSTDAVLPIDNFPPTSVAKFGHQLTQLVIKPKLEEIERWEAGQLIGLSYTDRYLRSPLSLLLAINTLAELKKSLARPEQDLPCTVTTMELRSNEWRRSPYRIWDDWEDERDRTNVAQGYASKMALDLDWKVGLAPHRRELKLTYEGGKTCRIFLDQGFGYWQSERPVKFDFGKNSNEQINALLRDGSFVKGNGQSYFAFKSD
jgi:DEAD/DEAH box helicase domain-containing protein